jgi:hypothetical protein
MSLRTDSAVLLRTMVSGQTRRPNPPGWPVCKRGSWNWNCRLKNKPQRKKTCFAGKSTLTPNDFCWFYRFNRSTTEWVQLKDRPAHSSPVGGFNGDLYAYLAGPTGGFAVLLNRVGVSNNATQFGYANSGFANVLFSDSAANSIQYYQNFSPTLNVNGQLTGTWQPEGVNLDPQSSPSSFFGAPQSALLGSFNGSNPNGVWVLFLADVAAGSQSTVVSWGLAITTTVPEPSALALTGAGLMAFLGCRRLRRS